MREKLKVWFGKGHEQNLRAESACIRRKLLEMSDAPSEWLLQRIRECCKRAVLAGDAVFR